MGSSKPNPSPETRDETSRSLLKSIPGLESVSTRVVAAILAGLAVLSGAVFKDTIVDPLVCQAQEVLDQAGCDLEFTKLSVINGETGLPELDIGLQNRSQHREYLTHLEFHVQQHWDIGPDRAQAGPVAVSTVYGAESFIYIDEERYQVSINEEIGSDETGRFSVQLVPPQMLANCRGECIYLVTISLKYGSDSDPDTVEGGEVVYSTFTSDDPSGQVSTAEPPPSINDLPTINDVGTTVTQPSSATSVGQLPPPPAGISSNSSAPPPADVTVIDVCSADVMQDMGTDTARD